MITEREENMAKLEKFERLASDPNRFFEKGIDQVGRMNIKSASTKTYKYELMSFASMFSFVNILLHIHETLYTISSDSVIQIYENIELFLSLFIQTLLIFDR